MNIYNNFANHYTPINIFNNRYIHRNQNSHNICIKNTISLGSKQYIEFNVSLKPQQKYIISTNLIYGNQLLYIYLSDSKQTIHYKKFKSTNIFKTINRTLYKIAIINNSNSYNLIKQNTIYYIKIHKKSVPKTPIKKAAIQKKSVPKTPIKKTAIQKKSVPKTPIKKTAIHKTPIKKVAIHKTPIKKAVIQKKNIHKTPIKKAVIQKTPIKKATIPKTLYKNSLLRNYRFNITSLNNLDIQKHKNKCKVLIKNNILLKPREYCEHSIKLKPNCSHSIYFNMIYTNLTLLIYTKNQKIHNSPIYRKKNVIFTNNETNYKIAIINNGYRNTFIYKNTTYTVNLFSNYSINLSIPTNKNFSLVFVSLNKKPNYKNIISVLNTNKTNERYLILDNCPIANKHDILLNYIKNHIKYYMISNNKFNIKNIDHILTIIKKRIRKYTNITIIFNNETFKYNNLNYTALKKELSKFYLPSQIKNVISISLASFPKRKHIIKDTLKSIIKNKPDIINCYLNSYDFDTIKQIFTKWHKINYIVDSLGSVRAAGKFFWTNEKTTHFICDDDIIYPINYISVCNKFIKKNANPIYSLLGVRFHKKITKYPSGKHRLLSINFRRKNTALIRVHLIGTGVSFFKLNNNFPPFEHFLKYVTYNDPCLAVYCKQHNVPLYTIPKPANWLKSNPKMDFGLYEEKYFCPVKNRVTKMIQQNEPWL